MRYAIASALLLFVGQCQAGLTRAGVGIYINLNTIEANNLTLTYGLSAATGTFSGALSAGSLSVTGSVDIYGASSFLGNTTLGASATTFVTINSTQVKVAAAGLSINGGNIGVGTGTINYLLTVGGAFNAQGQGIFGGSVTVLGATSLGDAVTDTLTLAMSTVIYHNGGIYLGTTTTRSSAGTISIVNSRIGVGTSDPAPYSIRAGAEGIASSGQLVVVGTASFMNAGDNSFLGSILVSSGITIGANQMLRLNGSGPTLGIIYATGGADAGIDLFTDATSSTSFNNGGVKLGSYAGRNVATPLGGLILTGNVGIANAAPAQKLHLSSGTILVDGNAAMKLRLGAYPAATDLFELYVGSAAKIGDALYVAGAGRVVGAFNTESTAVIASTTSITAGTFSRPKMTQAVLLGTTFAAAGEEFNCTNCPGAATTGFLMCISTGSTIMGAVISTAPASNCAGL